MIKIVGQTGLLQSFLNALQISSIVFAKPTGYAQAARWRPRRLAENSEGLGQRVQTFFGANTGKIADRVWTPVFRRLRAAMTSQVQAGIHHMDPRARNAEIVHHEVGIVDASRDETVDLAAMLANEIKTLAAVRLGQGFEVDVVALQRTEDRYTQALFELVHQSRQHCIRQIDDLGVPFVS